SIGNVGYALVGLAAATPDGVRGVLVYMAIYVVMTLGAFACILCMKVHDRMVEDISDLAGLSKTRPAIAFWLAVFMFSMAGIPPLAGFFGKLYVFMAAVDAGLITLAVIGVLTSVASAFYYMRIVKVMYFDEPAEAFDADSGRGLSMVMASTGTAILVLFPFVGVLVDAAAKAAASLGTK
ncbi:MAG: NADH-quinone oxidoreductase subunit N, partial [Alphaproteobacteria bacterium]|nr:NADH-quinone oxidoreductase subunit N [Alphaproteobacteria bacterium]